MNRTGNLCRAVRPLHGGGIHDDGYFGCAPLQGGHHVAQRGGGQTGYHADAFGPFGQRTFAFGGKQPLSLQYGLQPFVCLVKPPQTLQPHFGYRNLKFAPRLIDADAAAHFDMVALLQGGKPLRRAFKHRAAHLGEAVLQRKIIMPAGGAGQVGNLARNPQPGQIVFQQAFGQTVEFGNG